MNTGVEKEIQEKMVAVIAALLPRVTIYLFGSRARGTHAQWSDIDLALDAGSPLDMSTVGEISALMEALSIPYRVNVVDIHQVSETMKKEILRDKIIWKV